MAENAVFWDAGMGKGTYAPWPRFDAFPVRSLLLLWSEYGRGVRPSDQG